MSGKKAQKTEKKTFEWEIPWSAYMKISIFGLTHAALKVFFLFFQQNELVFVAVERIEHPRFEGGMYSNYVNNTDLK